MRADEARQEVDQEVDAAGVHPRPAPVPRWLALGFMVTSLLLAPWTLWLVWTLPNTHLADHWGLAWGGFDVALAGGLAVTAVLLLRRSPHAGIAAAVTATLLVCDAWFDVTTSGGMTTGVALSEALLIELPLAAVCLWIAANVERVLADPRSYLEQAGFGIVRRQSPPRTTTNQAPGTSDAGA